jgi:hypothetical protein
MEKIVLAAITFKGEIYVGRRHCEILRYIKERTGAKKVGGQWPQGFVTSEGRFVEREEAAKIALKSGQIEKLKFSSYQLFSEEIIP